MENFLDTFVVFKDASETEHHPAQRASRYQKFDSSTLMQQEELFRYKYYDQLFLHPKSLTVSRPWYRRPVKPLLSVEAFVKRNLFDTKSSYIYCSKT